MEDEGVVERQIHDLESQLLEPGVRTSREALEGLLAADFLEHGSSGRTWDREQTVHALATPSEVRYSLTDFRVRRLAPDVVLATYRAFASDGSSIVRESLRCSIWCWRGEGWHLVFHQGTPVPLERTSGGTG